jgi:hypothetical protein
METALFSVRTQDSANCPFLRFAGNGPLLPWSGELENS